MISKNIPAKSLQKTSITMLLLVHFFGLLGILSPFSAWFLHFTPLSLLVTAGILVANHPAKNRAFLWFALLTFFVGFFVEYFGVHYGFLFGNYFYGSTLGLSFAEIPLVIGINWFIVIYAVSGLVFHLKMPVYVKVILGAALATLLDFFIEPVAMTYDFWNWQNNTVPLSNYGGWFLVSAALIMVFYAFKLSPNRKMATWVYGAQFVFFLSLYGSVKWV